MFVSIMDPCTSVTDNVQIKTIFQQCLLEGKIIMKKYVLDLSKPRWLLQASQLNFKLCETPTKTIFTV